MCLDRYQRCMRIQEATHIWDYRSSSIRTTAGYARDGVSASLISDLLTLELRSTSISTSINTSLICSSLRQLVIINASVWSLLVCITTSSLWMESVKLTVKGPSSCWMTKEEQENILMNVLKSRTSLQSSDSLLSLQHALFSSLFKLKTMKTSCSIWTLWIWSKLVSKSHGLTKKSLKSQSKIVFPDYSRSTTSRMMRDLVLLGVFQSHSLRTTGLKLPN